MLPNCIQQIVEDTLVVMRVASRVSNDPKDNVFRAFSCAANHGGMICNVNLDIEALHEAGFDLLIGEDLNTGRFNVVARKVV